MMAFVDFARAHGVEIDRLEQGDRIYRCPTTDHPRSKNGAYFFDGRRGFVQNWETGEPAQWWNDDKATPWSDAEKREWANKQAAAKQLKEKGYADAVKRAVALLSTAKQSTHPYLVEKGFPEVKTLVSPDGEMLVPMRDQTTNALMGIQVIKLAPSHREWEKKMIYGMKAKGAVYRIGSRASTETYLVEGYSTGLSVDTALRLLKLNASVLVCFSAQNLVHVAQNSAGRLFVFADNDESQTGEKVAIATGLPYVMSDRVGEDANDLHQRVGVMAVAQKILDVRKRPP